MSDFKERLRGMLSSGWSGFVQWFAHLTTARPRRMATAFVIGWLGWVVLVLVLLAWN